MSRKFNKHVLLKLTLIPDDFHKKEKQQKFINSLRFASSVAHLEASRSRRNQPDSYHFSYRVDQIIIHEITYLNCSKKQGMCGKDRTPAGSLPRHYKFIPIALLKSQRKCHVLRH